LGDANVALHSPAYAPNGQSVVFESDWDGEQIWRWTRANNSFELIDSQSSNDNTPCVLPDGSVISLWLERPEGDGNHEIKHVAPDGSYEMLLTDIDVHDDTIGCGGE
jgi:hypothetical protein